MNHFLKSTPLAAFLLLLCSMCRAQQYDDTSNAGISVQMDEVTITAARSGWDLYAFIRRVKNDTTFYKSFRLLRFANYSAVNDIRILDEKGSTIASLYSKTRQHFHKGCRSMDVLEEKTTGNFYRRNGDYNYFTAELYAYLMFTKGVVCGESDVVAGSLTARGKGQMEKSKAQLKQLIFNPGSKVSGVPFMGDKASIFDPAIAKMYDFKLLSVEYNGEACYLFRALPKPEYAKSVVFNELSTWFRKSDYAIVARDYALSFSTMFYDFDVQMQVRLTNVDGRMLPSKIDYFGNWHVATKKRERARFTAVFSY